MKARTLGCIVSLSLAMAACNDQQAGTGGNATPPTETAAPASPAPPAPADTTDTEGTSTPVPQDRAALPETASLLPFAGLAGLLSLGIAIALRASRRQ
jgi:hypothetical protein